MAQDSLSLLLDFEAEYLEAFRSRVRTTMESLGGEIRDNLSSALQSVVEEEFASFHGSVAGIFDDVQNGIGALVPEGGMLGGLFQNVLGSVLGAVLNGKNVDARSFANVAAQSVVGELGGGRFSASEGQKAANAARGVGKAQRDL